MICPVVLANEISDSGPRGYLHGDLSCVFGKPALSRILGLFPGGFGATTSGYEHLVDAVDREGHRVEVIAEPVSQFFVLFVVGVSDGLNEIIKSWNAPTVIRWTRELTIRADRIARNRINRKL